MCFNSRTHVGCDTSVPPRPTPGAEVSIHAPTWGATICWTTLSYYWLVSIHAPTWGATTVIDNSRIKCKMFQFTHPRGVRLRLMISAGLTLLFQFTHPRGVRPFRWSIGYLVSIVSIHAPTWGATARRGCPVSHPYGFNSRTHVGCDPD